MSGRIRGKHLTFINAGYLLGPFLSTYVLDKLGYGGIYTGLLIFNAVIFVVVLLSLRHVNHQFKDTATIEEFFKKILKRRDILRIYYISFALEFFYALMVIYTPIYLADLGFSWEKIGVIFTAMLLPFVLLQYPMGFLADKKYGEKEFLMIALVVMTFSSSIIYFTATRSLFIWSVILFSTRIGAAMLEVLRDSYFYKRIDGNEVDLINFFRTAMPMAFILSSIITFPLLLIFPLKSVFLVASGVILSALIPTFFLVDNKSEKENGSVVISEENR